MSPDRKHGRDAAHRRAAAQAAAHEAHRRRQKRLRGIIAGGVALAVLAGVGFGFSGGGGKTPTAITTTTTIADDFGASGASGATGPTAPETAPNGFVYGTGACPPAEKPDTTPSSFDAPPKKCIDDNKKYTAEVDTSEGSFTITLLPDKAPGTVNNFVVLARYGFYDGSSFHRVVPNFMNQGGDPLGTGRGGPGYQLADELPASPSEYIAGAVAMANAGPNTNGSQFFTCVNCSVLAASYSLFGQVTEGYGVIQKINALGTGDGPPSKQVSIDSVTITEQ